MKKGFTLIELLAVIVILAIIALIATPIILGIINDARKESNERSVELYASAVRNAIAAYQLTGTKAPESFEDLDIEYDGDVVCATEELYENGSFYIADCTVNGTEVEYTYGEIQEALYTQVYKPQYYSWGTGSFSENLIPSDKEIKVSDLNISHPIYLGLDVDDNNNLSEVYMCFIRKGREYCLPHLNYIFETSKAIIEDAFKDVEDACTYYWDSPVPEIIVNRRIECIADGFKVNVYDNSEVIVEFGSAICQTSGADFWCSNQ